MVDKPEYNILKDTFIERISKAFSDPKNVRNIITVVQKYADIHSNILLTTDMSERLIFSENDKKVLFNITGISEEELKKAIDKTKLPSNWVKANNTFYMLSLLCISYFYNKGGKENKQAGDFIAVYLGYNIYTSSHKGFFKFLPDKATMEYTINNLTDKYYLKTLGSIHAVITKTVVDALDGNLKAKILSATDQDCADVISGLSARISSFVKNIADEFYSNKASGKALYHESDNEDPEDYHISDSNSYRVERLVRTTVTDITTKGFDVSSVVKLAVSISDGVSDKKIITILNTIVKKDLKSIPKFIEWVITLYLMKDPNNSVDDIKTNEFISRAMQNYKSNAQDNITFKIKDKLVEWLELTTSAQGYNYIPKGKTSMDNYKRCIYACFVFQINHSAK